MRCLSVAFSACLILSAGVAPAATRIQTGSANGLSYTAASRIVAATPTGVATPAGQLPVNPGGGDPAYLANNRAGYSGVVGMLMTYANGDRFVCSGSLVGDRSVVTAGHCVSSGGGRKDADLVRTQVFFEDQASSDLDQRIYGIPTIPTGATPPGVTVIDVATYTVARGYTGEVIDQNDIAVLRLSEFAPAYAQRYALHDGNDLTGLLGNITGYGTRSAAGGFEGYTGLGAGAGTGYRRQGNNIYDYALGDDAFGGFFTDRVYPGNENFFGTAEIEYSFVSDFDNGLAANDQACRIAAAVGAPAGFGCGSAPVLREANIAGGDSGGGAFINGQLASVNSYGLSFGTAFGDFKPELQSSWGEFSGYVPIFIHRDFINSTIAAIPEPSQWAQMMLGFGLVGAAMRGARRRTAAAA